MTMIEQVRRFNKSVVFRVEAKAGYDLVRNEDNSYREKEKRSELGKEIG